MARCNSATMQRPSRIRSKDATANRVPASDASWHMHSWHMPNHGMQQHEMFKVEASNTSSGSSQRLTYGKSHQGPCFTLAALAARNLPGRSLSGGFGLCTKLGHWLCVNPSRKDLGESSQVDMTSLSDGFPGPFCPCFLECETRLCMSKTTSWFIIKVAPRTWL